MFSRRYLVTGRVQGVAFRFYTRAEARRLNITGWCRNLDDGSAVEIYAQGSHESLLLFEQWLPYGSPASKVSGVKKYDLSHDMNGDTFEIVS